MKTIIAGSTLLLILVASQAQDPYTNKMEQSLSVLDTADTRQTLLYLSNGFEQISGGAPDQWLPCYYAAYCHARISHLTRRNRQRDLYVDRARFWIERADSLSPGQSEIWVMKGFILQARMQIEPMTRGPKYNEKCLEMFRIARKLNPENPRAYLWEGVQRYNLPPFMGGGKDRALPLLDTALTRYETFRPADPLHPDWGKSYADSIRNLCLE